MMRYKPFFIALFLFFFGCATRSDVIQNNVSRDFRSAKSPGALAVCIDRNAGDVLFNSLRSKIINVPGEPVEVLIINGATVYAVVQIGVLDRGSIAVFYFGGSASFTPDGSLGFLTVGCK